MRYRDNIEWLKSLKQQIGQTQHRDLWHFEQVIDETIDNLRPLAEPHGRLIDADKLLKSIEIMKRHKCETCECRIDTKRCNVNSCWMMFIAEFIEELPSVIEAEVSE